VYVFRTSVDDFGNFCARKIVVIGSVGEKLFTRTWLELACYFDVIRATQGPHVKVVYSTHSLGELRKNFPKIAHLSFCYHVIYF
jgi:hypothetical protein